MGKILIIGDDSIGAIIATRGLSSNAMAEYNLSHVEPSDMSKYALPLKKAKNSYKNDPLRPFHYNVKHRRHR